MRLNPDQQLANRVCLKLGIADPEQWFEDTPRRVMDMWRAHYANEPWGDEQLLLCKVVYLLSILAAKAVGEAELVEMVHENMPASWVNQPKAAEPMTLHEQLHHVAEHIERSFSV